MAGKKKQDLDPSTLPQIRRILVVLRALSGFKDPQLRTKLGEIILKSQRTDTLPISENIIKEWAQENELWFDKETWDGKKKINEEIPTEWTQTLKNDL